MITAIPRFVRWKETRLYIMEIRKTRRVRLWVRLRSLSYFSGGVSWYSDATTRDLGIHLFIISFGIKWRPRDINF